MTNIGPSLTITGDITSREDMTVQGTVKGTISMPEGALVISRTGTAEATLQGSNISVHGTVSGDLLASGKIEVTETAKVNGTITAPSLVLLAGAVVNGKVEVWTKDAKKDGARPNIRIVEPDEIAS